MRLLLAAIACSLALAGCAGDGDAPGGGSAGGPSSTTGTPGDPPPASPPPPPETHESVMRNNRFEPADFTVRVGDTIHWTTEDPQAHNVVSSTAGSEFRSSEMSILPVLYDQEFSYTFTKEGQVDYVCEYHSGMVGRVTVVPASS